MRNEMHRLRIETRTPASERGRLDRHFRHVLDHLRSRPTRRLRPAQRRARAHHLEALEAYRRRGRFPRNRNRAIPFPIFVDDVGTRCAMAHLIEGADGADLVRTVADTRNEARIHELASSEALLLWLADNGLTVEEAALIQPAYCQSAAQCICNPVDTILSGDVTAESTMTVTEVLGASVGVDVGDTLEFSAGGIPIAVNVGDEVFATSADQSFAWLVGVADSAGGVIVSDCLPGTYAPGPLPEGVFVDAMLADVDGCASILDAYDPAWTEEQGDCNSMVGAGGQGGAGGGGGGEGGSVARPKATDSGCSFGPAGSGPGVAFTVIAGALVLLRLRRRG